MTRRSSKFLIAEDAHLVMRPDGVPNGEDPWTLSFANGHVDSDAPEHQAVTIAWSDGGGELELEFFRWMADQLAGALGVNLILPEEGDYIMPNGMTTKMTPEMKERYPSSSDYLGELHGKVHEVITVIDREHDDSPYNPHHNHED